MGEWIDVLGKVVCVKGVRLAVGVWIDGSWVWGCSARVVNGGMHVWLERIYGGMRVGLELFFSF